MQQGGYKEMVGTETQIKQLEQNYYKKNMLYYNWLCIWHLCIISTNSLIKIL